MTKFLIDLVVNAFGFFVAITLLRDNGIDAQSGGWVTYLVLSLIFGIVNAIVRPILTVLGCPLIILTLGLGILLINTLLFYLTGWIGTRFGYGFTVDGFIPALLGALIVSVIGIFFNMFLKSEKKR